MNCCAYAKYYENQAGGGIGVVFRGAPFQRGHGIGSFFGGLFRSVLPLFKSGARALGHEALRTSANILNDVSDRQPIKNVIQKRIKEAGERIKRKAEDKISKVMDGSGYKRRRTGVASSRSVARLTGPRTRKVNNKKKKTPVSIRSREDIFD